MKDRIETLKARVQMVVDLMPDEMAAEQALAQVRRVLA